MNDRRASTVEIAILGWQAAYMSANPGNVPSRIIYANGWVKFYDAGYCWKRIRLAELDKMTERLLARVRATATAPGSPGSGLNTDGIKNNV